MDIENKILTIIRTEFNRPESILESRLYSDLHFSELDMMMLMFALEEDFDIEILDEDMVIWVMVKDVIEYVKTKKEEK